MPTPEGPEMTRGRRKSAAGDIAEATEDKATDRTGKARAGWKKEDETMRNILASKIQAPGKARVGCYDIT